MSSNANNAIDLVSVSWKVTLIGFDKEDDFTEDYFVVEDEWQYPSPIQIEKIVDRVARSIRRQLSRQTDFEVQDDE
jgi:tRNA(Ser,Leu) C12 N-acetylase TAN1